MTEYDEFQSQIKNRYFCIGWRQEDSQAKHYYQALFNSWHEAATIAREANTPGNIPFVEAANEIIDCPRCKGTGDADRVGNDHNCAHCHGIGKIRKP